MKKVHLKTLLLTITLVLALASCGSYRSRDGLYRVAEEEQVLTEIETKIEAATIEEEFLDIFDEDIALSDPQMISEGFVLGRFTEMASGFVEWLREDVELNLKEDEAYESYDLLTIVPKDDLMSVVNVEVEHLMQFDHGTWTQRRSEYPGGNGYIVSTFSEIGGVYYYDLTYNDDSGASKVVTVVYDSLLDRFDYVSESFNNEQELSYKVRQQYCRHEDGGYYYQALRHSVIDNLERASFSYFDETSYVTYITPTKVGMQLQGFIADLYQNVPNDLEQMIVGYEAGGHFSHTEEQGFKYELSSN